MSECTKAHCWENGPITDDGESGTTCMLPDGHDGPHEWTRDDEIRIIFAPLSRKAPDDAPGT